MTGIRLNIDFHSHFYPRQYLDGLKESGGNARLRTTASGEAIIEYSGDYNIIAGGHVNLLDRLGAMKRFGVDMQVLTLTTPGVEREDERLGIRLATSTNDAFGDIAEKYPDSFVALATLPMQSPSAAVEELERAVRDRGLRGAMMFSNVAGRPIDGAEYLPVFEKAQSLDVPVFIHPTTPINGTCMQDYRLVPIMGFGVDTSLAIVRLVFSGIFERLPDLKLVATHTGGVFPYLRGRIEAAYDAYPETRVNMPHRPSEYFRRVWLDTVCYDRAVLESSMKFWGPGKMVMGSDYPHQIGDLKNCVSRLMQLDMPDEERELVLGRNAAELLRIG